MIEVKLTFATEQEMLMYFQARDNEALRKQAEHVLAEWSVPSHQRVERCA